MPSPEGVGAPLSQPMTLRQWPSPSVGWDSMCHQPHFDMSWITVDLDGGTEHCTEWGLDLRCLHQIVASLFRDTRLESHTVPTRSWHHHWRPWTGVSACVHLVVASSLETRMILDTEADPTDTGLANRTG